jgi:Ca2+-binding RTX toxin-like protein
VNSSTITQNTTSGNGGGIFIFPASGALVAANNTIIAENFDNNSSNGISPDVSGNFDTSRSSFNLIGIGTDSNFTNGVNGNIVGTSDNPIDPLLGPLQDNGGPTFTHALLPGSPAIDAANPNFNVLIDQRGVTRPQGNGFDIGAFESTLLSPGVTLIGTPNDDNWTGGEGDDTLNGFNSQDILQGLAGDDLLDGGDGDDRLFGGEDNDTLLGGSGQDRLFGEAGDDLLDGGAGDNILNGGLDSDIFIVSTEGKNTIVDFEDGQDRLKLVGGLTFE